MTPSAREVAMHCAEIVDGAMDCGTGWNQAVSELSLRLHEYAATLPPEPAAVKGEPVAWTTQLALECARNKLGLEVSAVNLWGERGIPLYAAEPAAVPEADLAWLHTFLNCVPFGEHAPSKDIHRAHKIVDALAAPKPKGEGK
jgi:hypothetical protein